MKNLLKGMSENRSGVSLLGVPLGSDDYIKTFLLTKVQCLLADFPNLNKLTAFKVCINFVRFCLALRLHYLLRVIEPALSLGECANLDTTSRINLFETMGWESFDPPAHEGYEGEGFEEICEDTTRWSHYYIFGSLARGSLGIPRAEDVARPAFYCATVDYVTAIAALEPHPLLAACGAALRAGRHRRQRAARARSLLSAPSPTLFAFFFRLSWCMHDRPSPSAAPPPSPLKRPKIGSFRSFSSFSAFEKGGF